MTTFKVYGEHEAVTLQQMQTICSNPKVQHAVLCADGHLGYSVPVGGVVAYEGCINVSGVGFDIACGNKAVRLDCSAEEVRNNCYRNANEIQKHISFGMGRKNNEKVEHELFSDPLWNDIDILASLKSKAADQLGTVGGGNHFVDVFVDQSDRVWVGVHFGSRGLGHSIATHFVKAAGGKDGVHAESVILDENSDLGEQYLKCMELAGRYAYAGRDWVSSRVAKILRSEIVEEIHNHHNFAWKERHYDKDLWVIRKGSTPAFPGQKGFVGGSMGDISVILEGQQCQEAEEALFSTVHGAGRTMGRTAAKGKYDRKGRCVREGLVKRHDHDAWMKKRDVEVRGGGLDESPLAYKRIEEVLQAHKGTIKILNWLTPMIVVMADDRNFDPYKD